MMGTPYSDPILDSINEGVFTVDHDWRITAFNQAAERITGVRKQDARGRVCCDVFRASICEGECALRRTFSSGKPVVGATANIINASGKQIPIRISTALLRGQDGAVIGGVESFQDLSHVEQLRKELEARYTFEDIVGRSPAMQSLFEIVPQIAASHSTVLIEGNSGTGKEMFARAIHNLSPRAKKRFVAVNCAALPDALLESELFGYKAGAFTDAKRDKPGRFALADGGTIFLDEIGDMPLAMQAKLLRVLEEGEVERIGADKPTTVDVRVVVGTHRNLEQLVESGGFRRDLYHRVVVFPVELPPLRRRAEDLPALVEHFARQVSAQNGWKPVGFTDAAIDALKQYAWPGNIRELRNVVERLLLLAGSVVDAEDVQRALPSTHSSAKAVSSTASPLAAVGPLAERVLTFEREEVLRELERHNRHITQTAKALGLERSHLYKKCQQLGINLQNLQERE